MEVQYSVLAPIIAAIGADHFAAVTGGALRSFLGFELTAVFVHRAAAEPAVLFDNFEGRGGIANYIRFTHRLNPMLTHASGACRASDFAVDLGDAVVPHIERAADEELGFRTVGWPPRQEEVGLYLESGAGLIELGFYRPRGRSAAPADKVGVLQALAAPITAAFDRHYELIAPLDLGTLSPREREIYDLLLRGCSSAAIALRLDISRHTVKDHRKSIFRKLQVGSLAELFALRGQPLPGGMVGSRGLEDYRIHALHPNAHRGRVS
jgi:DNA-binding CsgD family transcriptional regulator